MAKKVVGVLFLILGVFFILVIISQTISFVNLLITITSSTRTGYGSGYAFGQAIGLGMFITLTYYLLKVGASWIRPQNNI